MPVKQATPTHVSLAEELLQAERTGAGIKHISGRYPDFDQDDAYAIQLEVQRRKQQAGARIVGRKIGLTSKAMQRLFDVDTPDYGHLLDNMAVPNAGSIRRADLIQPKAEPEIAFILGKPLRGPGVTRHEVLAATEAVAPAIEIIDSRFESWKIRLVDTVADNASGVRYIVGDPVSPDGLDLRLLGMVLERDGQVTDTAAGAAALDDPAIAVMWLVNKLADFGEGLNPGDVVLPGALCGAIDCSAGMHVEALFDRIGSVSVRFE